MTSGDPAFRSTRWSLVLEAGRDSSPRAKAALASLCEGYWYPLYSYVRRRGYGRDEASDLTQEFFHQVLRREDFRAADPEKGRFRSFLLTAMRNFLANEWKAAHAIKRGGGDPVLSLDVEAAEDRFSNEPIDAETPEKAFEKIWATELLSRCLEALKKDYEERGRGILFESLVLYLSPGEPPQSKEIASRLGLSDGALKVAVHRLRQRYRETLRRVIAETVASEADLDEEIGELFAAFSTQ